MRMSVSNKFELMESGNSGFTVTVTKAGGVAVAGAAAGAAEAGAGGVGSSSVTGFVGSFMCLTMTRSTSCRN